MLVDGGTPSEQDTLSRHFARLDRLASEGKVLLAGRTQNTDPSSFGIVIFEATDEVEAQQFVDEDPAVVESVMTAELFPYRVAAVSGHLSVG